MDKKVITIDVERKDGASKNAIKRLHRIYEMLTEYQKEVQ